MPDAHPNFAWSTVATAPSPASSGTSLVVASGEGARFGSVCPFNAVVCPAGTDPTSSNAEIVRVTARSTDTLSPIVRAQEGTSARTIVAGDRIYAAVTKKSLTDLEAAFGFTEGRRLWAPTGAIAETFSRFVTPINAGVLVSQRLQLTGGCVIPANVTVSNISVMSGSTAMSAGTNQFFCLVDQSANILAKTADDGATAWAATAVKTLAISGGYTPTADIAAYVGVVVNATTVPTLLGVNNTAAGVGVAPFIARRAQSGVTTPASLTSVTFGVVDTAFYAYLT